MMLNQFGDFENILACDRKTFTEVKQKTAQYLARVNAPNLLNDCLFFCDIQYEI